MTDCNDYSSVYLCLWANCKRNVTHYSILLLVTAWILTYWIRFCFGRGSCILPNLYQRTSKQIPMQIAPFCMLRCSCFVFSLFADFMRWNDTNLLKKENNHEEIKPWKKSKHLFFHLNSSFIFYSHLSGIMYWKLFLIPLIFTNEKYKSNKSSANIHYYLNNCVYRL